MGEKLDTKKAGAGGNVSKLINDILIERGQKLNKQYKF
jgi:hypothetical protein